MNLQFSMLLLLLGVRTESRQKEADHLKSLMIDVYDQRQFFGLKQYLKAINFLRDRIGNLEDPQSSQVALITCLLFICHEMLREQRVGAISHLATGLPILFSRTIPDSTKNSTVLILKYDSEEIQDQLLSIFARLDYESTMFGQRAPRFFLYPAQKTRTRDLSVPSNFSSLSEARQYIDILASGTLRFRGKLLELASVAIPNASLDFLTQALWEHATARVVDLSEHTTMFMELRRLQDALAVWFAAFKTFKDGLDPVQRDQSSAALFLLEIQHFYPYFLLAACQTTKEKYCDSFNRLFQRIVSLASSYIEGNNASTQPSFTIDSGVIPSLYITAVKCRHRETRRKAKSLLRRSACQEGMWEGALIAGFAERIADLEEARALDRNEFGEVGEIDEVARFCDVCLAVTPDPTMEKLICARYCHEIGGGLMVWDEWLFSFKE